MPFVDHSIIIHTFKYENYRSSNTFLLSCLQRPLLIQKIGSFALCKYSSVSCKQQNRGSYLLWLT